MSEIKHTPGPWGFGEFQLYEGAEKRFNISQVEGAPYTPHHSDVAITIPGERMSIQEANARLIAAAPDLYEALIQITNGVAGVGLDSEPDIYADYDRLSELVGQARAAIAKATGES